jgi:hypothetical protein
MDGGLVRMRGNIYLIWKPSFRMTRNFQSINNPFSRASEPVTKPDPKPQLLVRY